MLVRWVKPSVMSSNYVAVAQAARVTGEDGMVVLSWREPGLDLVPVEIKGPLISMGIESGTTISNRLIR